MAPADEMAAWREAVPALVEDAVRRWSLRLDEPYPNASVSVVFPARRGSDLVVRARPTAPMR